MSARYQIGFRLTDGEVLERLWSFLRRFSKMTKEMRSAHRVDVLTDALIYYSQLTSENLSKTISYICVHTECLHYFFLCLLENLLPKRFK